MEQNFHLFLEYFIFGLKIEAIIGDGLTNPDLIRPIFGGGLSKKKKQTFSRALSKKKKKENFW